MSSLFLPNHEAITISGNVAMDGTYLSRVLPDDQTKSKNGYTVGVDMTQANQPIGGGSSVELGTINHAE